MIIYGINIRELRKKLSLLPYFTEFFFFFFTVLIYFIYFCMLYSTLYFFYCVGISQFDHFI